MKSSTWIAIAVFAALAIAAVFTLQKPQERGISRFSLAEIEPGKISRIEMNGTDGVELKKVDGIWLLSNGQPADEGMVQRLLDTLPRIQSSDLITSDSAQYEALEVNETKGTRIKAFAGGSEVADFVVGQNRSGGVAIRKGDDVYNVAGVYNTSLVHKAADWLERRFFKGTADEVVRVDVMSANTAPYSLMKDGDAWKLSEGQALPADFRFDANGARAWVETLVRLRAKELLEVDPGLEKTQLNTPHRAYTLHYKGANAATPVTLELRIGAESGEGARYAQLGSRKEIMTIAPHDLRNLFREPTDFRDLSFVKWSQGKATRVEIVDGTSRLTLVHSDTGWKIDKASPAAPADFELDSAAVDQRLMALQRARANAMAESTVTAASAKLLKPSSWITVKFDNGESATLTFGGTTRHNDQEALYAQGQGDKAIYIVDKWLKTNLVSGLESMRLRAQPDGLEELDPATLSRLPPEIQASFKKQLEERRREAEAKKQAAPQN